MPCLSSLIRFVIPLACTLCTLLRDVLRFLCLCLRPSPALAAENLFLRKQLALYQEHHVTPRRVTHPTRVALVWLSWWCEWRPALAVVQPETFRRWRRQGFRLFWHGTPPLGRPPIPMELQTLIRQMARDNCTWGQQRIANELRLKLGLRVSPRTIRKYMPTHRDRTPGHRVTAQRWRTFLRNHAWDLIVRGVASDLARGVQALTARIRWLLQRCRRPTVASELRVTSPRDATCLSRLSAPTLGLAVWSPVIVEVIGADQRSPPDGGPSCVHTPGLTSRATSVSRCDVCPAGAGLCWRNRASPRTRSVRSWSKGGSRVAPWRRAA
jgi:hypothetical protein